jgi:hypothetical protein
MKERKGNPGTNLLPWEVGLDCIRSHVTNYKVAIASHSFSTSLFVLPKRILKHSPPTISYCTKVQIAIMGML